MACWWRTRPCAAHGLWLPAAPPRRVVQAALPPHVLDTPEPAGLCAEASSHQPSSTHPGLASLQLQTLLPTGYSRGQGILGLPRAALGAQFSPRSPRGTALCSVSTPSPSFHSEARVSLLPKTGLCRVTGPSGRQGLSTCSWASRVLGTARHGPWGLLPTPSCSPGAWLGRQGGLPGGTHADSLQGTSHLLLVLTAAGDPQRGLPGDTHVPGTQGGWANCKTRSQRQQVRTEGSQGTASGSPNPGGQHGVCKDFSLQHWDRPGAPPAVRCMQQTRASEVTGTAGRNHPPVRGEPPLSPGALHSLPMWP